MPHIVMRDAPPFILEWSIAAEIAMIRCPARGRTYGDGDGDGDGAGLLLRLPGVLFHPDPRRRRVPADRDGDPAPAAHVADRRPPLPRLRRGTPGVRAVLPAMRKEAVGAKASARREPI